MTIRLVKTEQKEQVLSYLYEEDPLLNAYTINRIQNRVYGKTATFLSIQENSSEIDGYLSILYGGGIDVWLRGKSIDAEKELLNFFAARIYSSETKRKMYISSNPRANEIIREILPECKIDVQNVMTVGRGEEKLTLNSSVVRISEDHAEDYSKFLVPHDIEITSELLENNRKFLQEHLAYGIFDHGKIISVASSFVNLPHVSIISGIETRPEFRRRGFATAVVSTLVREVLASSDAAMLYVNNYNYEAIRVYERLGFHKIAESVCAEN